MERRHRRQHAVMFFPFFHFSILPFFHLFVFCFLVHTAASPGQEISRGERTYDVLHYRIDVRLDEAARRVEGVTDITLAPLRSAIDSVVLDAVAMNIARVSLVEDGAEEQALTWRYDSSRLAVVLPGPLASGERRTLRVRYSCVPQRGLYFIGPDASFPDDPRQIWTQGQGEDNRHWFPCYDYPDDKAVSEVVMTVDTALRALSNGTLRERHDNGDGTATWHWVQEQPHSSYLVMLAAGRYGVFRDERGGIPVESWHYLSDDTADVRRTYGDTGDMLVFFSEYTSVPYPWAKYAQIPVRHFPYGGMENTSATVMADTRMVVDARAALDYDPQPLIAHELAHQWFGDYVTYIDWTHEWLNEGFATFFQQLWTRERFGRDDFLIQRFNGIRNYLDWADRSGRIPIVGERRGGAANTYSKGAAALHMLRDITGEEEFRRVIRAWLTRHALGSVETHDFARTIEDVTGRRLRWFLEQWIYGAGYPEIKITRETTADGDSLRMVFRQMQKTDSLCGYFRMPVTLRWPSGRHERVWIDGRETVSSVAISHGDGSFVEVDPENVLCARIAMDHSVEELRWLLREAGSPVQRMLAAERLMTSLDSAGVRDALFDAAERDTHRDVRKAVATKLAELRPEAVGFADELRALFIRLAGDTFPGVRATALNGLYNFRDAALLPLFRGMLSDSSYYVEAAAMNCILAVDSTGSADVLTVRLEKKSYGDVLALAAMDWVQRYRIAALLPAIRRLSAPGNAVAVRTKALETLIVLREAPETLHALLGAWLDEPQAAIRGWAVSAVQIFGRDEARRMLGTRAATERHPQLRALMRERYGL